jgi:hypothetical protein
VSDFDYPVDESELTVDELDLTVAPRRVSKDMRRAAQTLKEREVRYLVDSYYQFQEYRKASDNQAKAAATTEDGEEAEPNDAVKWLGATMHGAEDTIKVLLDVYTKHHPVGRWLQSVCGVGPVIAAGLLAHIDIKQAPTVGHIWRFAGLDPTVEWGGTAAARELVKCARQAEGDDHAALVWLAKATHRKPFIFYTALGQTIPHPDDVQIALLRCGVYSESIEQAFKEHPIEITSAVELACEIDNTPLSMAYASMYPGLQIDWDAVQKVLAKRPWNAALKTLCWKAGQSFVKVSNNPNDVYGKMYRDRKVYEWRVNLEGGSADDAAMVLARKKIGRTTEAYNFYAGCYKVQPGTTYVGRPSGAPVNYPAERLFHPVLEKVEVGMGMPMLPPGHIQARSTRRAVKVFLSHLHHVWHEVEYGKPPPKPYVLERMGHVHYLAPPNWPLAA